MPNKIKLAAQDCGYIEVESEWLYQYSLGNVDLDELRNHLEWSTIEINEALDKINRQARESND